MMLSQLIMILAMTMVLTIKAECECNNNTTAMSPQDKLEQADVVLHGVVTTTNELGPLRYFLIRIIEEFKGQEFLAEHSTNTTAPLPVGHHIKIYTPPIEDCGLPHLREGTSMIFAANIFNGYLNMNKCDSPPLPMPQPSA